MVAPESSAGRESALVQFLANLVADNGTEVVRAGTHVIMEYEDQYFALDKSNQLLTGPYSWHQELLEAEGERVFIDSWEGGGPGASGSDSVFRWRGALIHRVDGFDPVVISEEDLERLRAAAEESEEFDEEPEGD